MIRAAIFDMDGLMIDSDAIISRSYELILMELGKEPILNERGVVHTPGISAVDNWKRLAEIYGIQADIEYLAQRKNQLHVELIKQGVDPMPGLFEVLGMFKDHGIKMAIASSSKQKLVEFVVDHLNIGKYFYAIVAGDDVANGKPAPDIFLAAAESLEVQPIDCVVIEDSINGVRAAKAAGMKCIAVPAKSDLDDPAFEVADMVAASLENVNWDAIAR